MSSSLKIKEKVKERYGKIALIGGSCCAPSVGGREDEGGQGCCTGSNETALQPLQSLSPEQVAELVGYDSKELKSIPEASILGVGCGTPTKFAFIKEGDMVIDLGSGAGIDVFLAANVVKDSGRIIGIDMTDEMLQKSRKNAAENGYTNVEFRKGDIEERIPIDDNSADIAISNCVINLTTDKSKTFREIYRILKPNGIGRMVISDLVTDKQIENTESIDPDKWCSCIDGTLTRQNYIASIRKAGFKKIEVIDEKIYTEGDETDNRKITSLVIKAVKE
jgi:ubiquinone/menaquinone biosynthesis C-methylase UbiE